MNDKNKSRIQILIVIIIVPIMAYAAVEIVTHDSSQFPSSRHKEEKSILVTDSTQYLYYGEDVTEKGDTVSLYVKQ